jgi:hypothetical protein
MGATLIGILFVVCGATFLVLNLRRKTLPFGVKGSRFAYIAISIVPPIALGAFGLWIALLGFR